MYLYFLKIGAGKTALVYRFVRNDFAELQATIAMEYGFTTLRHKDDLIKVNIWDTVIPI